MRPPGRKMKIQEIGKVRTSHDVRTFLPVIDGPRLRARYPTSRQNGLFHLRQTIEITNVYNPKFRQLCFSVTILSTDAVAKTARRNVNEA